jgi:hypothetical protein
MRDTTVSATLVAVPDRATSTAWQAAAWTKEPT